MSSIPSCSGNDDNFMRTLLGLPPRAKTSRANKISASRAVAALQQTSPTSQLGDKEESGAFLPFLPLHPSEENGLIAYSQVSPPYCADTVVAPSCGDGLEGGTALPQSRKLNKPILLLEEALSPSLAGGLPNCCPSPSPTPPLPQDVGDSKTDAFSPGSPPVWQPTLVPPSQLPSKGSAGHAVGTCKPCAFQHTKGCENGEECSFCHLCSPEELKRRRKDKLEMRRLMFKYQRRNLAEKSAAANMDTNTYMIQQPVAEE